MKRKLIGLAALAIWAGGTLALNRYDKKEDLGDYNRDNIVHAVLRPVQEELIAEEQPVEQYIDSIDSEPVSQPQELPQEPSEPLEAPVVEAPAPEPLQAPAENPQPAAEARTQPGEASEDTLSFLDVYDELIDAELTYFGELHGVAPDRNYVKAMIMVESGKNVRDRKGAFAHDPMQIANDGDYALDVLANGRENTGLIGDFSSLRGKRHTPRKKAGKRWFWDYSGSDMTAEDSIHGGIGWLLHKAAVYDTMTVEEGPEKEYVIKKGDSFSRIASKLGTTVDVLEKYNTDVNPEKLKLGKKIKYVSARRETYISDWLPWEDAIRGYNGGGNSSYLDDVNDVKTELDCRDAYLDSGSE